MNVLAAALLFLLPLTLKHDAVAQTMQSDWLAKWANARAYTLAVAEAMPAEDYGYRPTDSARTFGGQLVHLGGNIEWVATSKLQDGERPARSEVDELDKAAVIAYLEQVFGTGAEALGKVTFAQLDERVDWFTGERISRRRVGLLLFDHVTHHRAQAITYLRIYGVEPPDYVGW